MGESEDNCSIQLMDGNGEFNVDGLDKFVKKTKLYDCGLSYAVVAIMGPQSSGKSTLLNHLFSTSFGVMDAFEGRSQTTKGIWMAKCVGIEPFTVAMDLEGTDGAKRGEDDTTFEKRSALFALAVADILLINIWCQDIGREHASNKPLLRMVFQVMTRLLSPRKTTLIFVIRDKTKTPKEKLGASLRDSIQKIWDSVQKTERHKNTPLSEFFKVEVVVLSSYEEKVEEFKEEVAKLRKRFFHSISPGGLAGDRSAAVPASGFSSSSQQLWIDIKNDRDLDIPAHTVLVATFRCEEIASEKLHSMENDKSWLELQEAVESGLVPGFGKKLNSILERYFSEYDAEAIYFDGGIRKEKLLKVKALNLVHSAYTTMLGYLRSNALESFKIRLEQSLKQGEGFAKAVRDSKESCLEVFNKGCEDAKVEQATWDASETKRKLCRDIDAHTSSALTAKLSELTAKYKKRLFKALNEPLESLFSAGEKETWSSIRKLLKRETETAVTEFLDVITAFELDDAAIDAMVQNLKDYSRSLVEKIARKEAGQILIRITDRFSKVFSYDKDSMPRFWTREGDIKAIKKDACAEALIFLSVVAAIRLDERPDNIESTLFSSLIGGNSMFLLASRSWEEVPPRDVVLTPVECESLWKQFQTEIMYIVTQAKSSQEAHKPYRTWYPFWLQVVYGIVTCGFIAVCGIVKFGLPAASVIGFGYLALSAIVKHGLPAVGLIFRCGLSAVDWIFRNVLPVVRVIVGFVLSKVFTVLKKGLSVYLRIRGNRAGSFEIALMLCVITTVTWYSIVYYWGFSGLLNFI